MADAAAASFPRLPAVNPGMRIGLFGGSFDPAHEGHLRVSLVALNTLRLDQVWWLVSPHNPLKPHAPSADLDRRIRAARLLARNPRIKVTGIEAEFGTTYTAETLARLAPRLHGVSLVWMMGADNLRQFHRWRDWSRIAAEVPLAVFNRPNEALAALASPAAFALRNARIQPNSAKYLAGMAAPAWVFLPSPHIDLSSTAIRRRGGTRQGAS